MQLLIIAFRTVDDPTLVPHSKRAMKNVWPDMCKKCPLYEELKWTCGAVGPSEFRHENAWVRMRNALEAIAESRGAEITPEQSISNLLSTIGLMTPYTMQWNEALIKSDECMGNPGNASRGLIKEFEKAWDTVIRPNSNPQREVRLGESVLRETLSTIYGKGGLYDAENRKAHGVPPATEKEELFPELTPVKTPRGTGTTLPATLPQFQYLREAFDDLDKRKKRGEL